MSEFTKLTDVVDLILDKVFDTDDDLWMSIGEEVDIMNNPKLLDAVKSASMNPKVLFENPRIKMALEKRFLKYIGDSLAIVAMVNDPNATTDEDVM